MTSCAICNRVLKTKASLRIGIGPTCLKKMVKPASKDRTLFLFPEMDPSKKDPRQ